MILRARKALITGVIGATAVIAGASTLAVAHAAPQPANGATLAASGELPPPAIEDFEYPDADKVLKEKGIKLVKGDGHIVMTECDAAPDFEVMANKGQHPVSYCFKVTGKTGYLTMEIPRIIGIMENEGRTAQATVTTEGKTKTVDLRKNRLTPLGEGDLNTGGNEATLLELRVKG
ncbi:hypothetical protein ABT168_26810 [Streptomyces sp. NPDC001793]|uniref:hypothetical protein n=1 Tax=Streptomyces sp. NPDC001793 TaxID=3154657 RepID=UPI00332C152F